MQEKSISSEMIYPKLGRIDIISDQLSYNPRQDTGFLSILAGAMFPYNQSVLLQFGENLSHDPFEKDDMTEATSAIKPPPTTTMRKGPRGEVRIFATWCKGCHICVEFCTTNVLAMHTSGDYPIVIASQKCTACHFCDTHCPDLAISVRKIE